jgi:beta-1,2-mannobiose phosphorylase / 1,2-beta-oligomannan phosphorylase
MLEFFRHPNNPLLLPRCEHDWESVAVFNPCVIKSDNSYHMAYRAQGNVAEINGHAYSASCIGYACGDSIDQYQERRRIISPDQPWDRFGCEDPRVTFLDGKYYIFYTALSTYPFSAQGIRIGVAITTNFVDFTKHPVTPFNAKAMALFPQRINGRLLAVLTVHTDIPPAKIALAWFDDESELWSDDYWHDWYRNLDSHVLPLLRDHHDLVEIGAPPVHTDQGWLLLYCYIKDYFSDDRQFSIEGALLDLDHPHAIKGRSSHPLLRPTKDYELKGQVRNVVFPSGALVEDGRLVVFYGAADSSCCAASAQLEAVLQDMVVAPTDIFIPSTFNPHGFERFAGNPVLSPRPEFSWEALATFNPGAIALDNRVHLLYRAMSLDGTSTLGYASSEDGVHFENRLPHPVYEPRMPFEIKKRPGNSGCEDPRLTLLDDKVYLFYTAFDGYTPRVAYSHLSVEQFLRRDWQWATPIVITPPGVDDKDACLMSRKLNGKFFIFHRSGAFIRLNSFDSLDFGSGHWVDDRSQLIRPRKEYWDNRKFGIAAPPIQTPHGWLLFFHRVTKPDSVYKVEAMLLDTNDPSHVIAESAATLLEPEAPEERIGLTANVVFPCGAVLHGNLVYLYYGAADRVTSVARMTIENLYARMGL